MTDTPKTVWVDEYRDKEGRLTLDAQDFCPDENYIKYHRDDVVQELVDAVLAMV